MFLGAHFLVFRYYLNIENCGTRVSSPQGRNIQNCLIKTMKLITVYTLAVILLGIGFLNGAIVTVNGFDANGTGGGIFTVTESGGGATSPNTYSFTTTGNLDGGTVNDTLSFDFIYTIYTGSTFDGTDVTLGTPVNYDSTSTNLHFANDFVGDPDLNGLSEGDSFTISVANISYVSGEGNNSPAVSFDGFNTIRKFGGGAGDVYIGTTGAVVETVGAATGSFIDLNGVTNLALTASTTQVAGQRLRDLNFSFTVPDAIVIPEPGTFGVVGFLGVMLTLLRRKRSVG